MTLLVILYNDFEGGAENVAKQLVAYFANNRNKVFVVFLNEKNSDFWNDIEKLDNVFLEFDISIRKLPKFINDKNADIVYTTHIVINSIVGFLRWSKLIHTKYLVARESTSIFIRYKGWKLFNYKLVYFFGYKKIDLIITQSDLMKDSLVRNASYLSKRTRIKTIPNPFKFINKVYNQDVKITKPFIVSVGRLIPEKGFDVLINAFENFIKNNNNYNLVILGEGPERSRLEELLIKKNLSKKVHLPGFVKNVYQYCETADICVVSSRKEGFPNVLLQMMSKNDRVVSTLCAGGIEQLEGVITCPSNNILALQLAIEKALKMDAKGIRERFDEELKSRSIENFVQQIEFYLDD